MIREGRRKIQVMILNNGKVRIKLRRKIYEVESDKILHVISILKNEKNIAFKGSKDVFKNLKKYKLIDEIFLCNINGLW